MALIYQYQEHCGWSLTRLRYYGHKHFPKDRIKTSRLREQSAPPPIRVGDNGRIKHLKKFVTFLPKPKSMNLFACSKIKSTFRPPSFYLSFFTIHSTQYFPKIEISSILTTSLSRIKGQFSFCLNMNWCIVFHQAVHFLLSTKCTHLNV